MAITIKISMANSIWVEQTQCFNTCLPSEVAILTFFPSDFFGDELVIEVVMVTSLDDVLDWTPESNDLDWKVKQITNSIITLAFRK